MITFYRNETDVAFELEPLENYPYYTKITVGYCEFDKELSPNDLYFDIEYASSNTGDITTKTVRYIIKNVNDDNYVTYALLKDFIPEDEDYPTDKIFCNIFNTKTYQSVGIVGGSGYTRISELPTKLYLKRQSNNCNVLSNNTLYKYGIPITFNNIISAINCSIINDVNPYIRVEIIRDYFLFRVENVYGVLENTPKGKEFVGFTFTPFSNKVDVKIGETLINDYVYNLYPVYEYVKTPTQEDLKTTITCYKNSADSIRVFKHDYLTDSVNFPDLIPITFLDDCDVINPIISLITDGKPIDFNYVYLTPLNRYYFVEDIVYKSNNVVELLLKIDILMSNAVGIRSLKAFVTRNEFQHNNSIIDDKRVVHSGTEISTIEIETNLFYDEDTTDNNDLGTLAINGFYMDVT